MIAFGPLSAAQQIPYITGEWSGPHLLDLETGAFQTREIVHAAVLPPPLTGEQTPRVWLAARPRSCSGSCDLIDPPGNFGRSYIWTERVPTNVTAVPTPPGYPTDGSQDFFCSGHAFLSDGNFIVVGGINARDTCVEQCNGRFIGHPGAWVLDTQTSFSPSWYASSTTLPLPRWYPTVTLMPGGLLADLMVIRLQ